jgi:alpha-L-fucosidase
MGKMLLTRREAFKILAGIALSAKFSSAGAAPSKFNPTWESLKQYRCPDWFRDAKLGIWAHWGPQCAPEQGDWYARNMYIEGSAQYRYHVNTYGHPSKFGYKDIIPLWKAENFDPDSLVRRYKEVGAKYFVALGVHHDNYDCWNSKHHRWNSVNVGPKKDIVGLWCEAARKHGLRFGVTEHLERSWSWFNVNKGHDKTGALAGVPYDGNDRKYADLYFEPHEETTPRYPANPSKAFIENWFNRITDLVDSYQPDLLYTDGGIPFGETGRKLVAHYYNQNMKWNGGRLEAVYNIKDIKESALGLCGEYQEGISVLDLERGIVDGVRNDPWQTDTCIGGWYYKKGMKYKTSKTVIHMLADIVSKNGNLLLNFPLKPDGALDAEAEAVLADLGKWMAVNSEAIHGTRPWKEYCDGLKRVAGGQFNEQNLRYSAEDIRFTTKGSTIYAIVLGWPNDKKVTLRSLAAGTDTGKIESIRLLGHDDSLLVERDASGLKVKLPDKAPCDHAVVLKIQISN